MEFRIATTGDQQGVENLWHYCFEHRDNPFFQYYFTKAYAPEHTLVGIGDTGSIETMVHMRPVTVDVRGISVDMSYLIGVATAPAQRGTGVGKTLLRACIGELLQRNQPISILMPSQAGFYQPYGWGLYCHQWQNTMPLADVRDIYDRKHRKQIQQVAIQDAPALQPWRQAYKEFVADKTGYVVRDEKDWTLLMDSLAAEDMQIAWVTEQERCTGYMIYHIADDTFQATEFVTLTMEARETLFAFMGQHRSQASTVSWNESSSDRTYLDWPNGKQGHQSMPFMMVRVHDVKAAMELIPIQNVENSSLIAFVKDPLLDEQSGWYQITAKANKTHLRVEKIEAPSDGMGDVTITVQGLGQLLMGGRSVSDLMFTKDLIIHSESVQSMLETWYPLQRTFINEWW